MSSNARRQSVGRSHVKQPRADVRISAKQTKTVQKQLSARPAPERNPPPRTRSLDEGGPELTLADIRPPKMDRRAFAAAEARADRVRAMRPDGSLPETWDEMRSALAEVDRQDALAGIKPAARPANQLRRRWWLRLVRWRVPSESP